MENSIVQLVKQAVSNLYQLDIAISDIQVTITRKEFKGDYTVVVFPFTKCSRKSPEQTGNDIGNYLIQNNPLISEFNVIKGFLNICFSGSMWLSKFNEFNVDHDLVLSPSESKKICIEFSSPNTNKPLHLGHIRNNLLGDSVSRILQRAGHNVVRVNLVNDRGIHICKSMLAWEKWGEGKTPENTGIKGDRLVGDFYVKFDQEYKAELKKWTCSGISEEEASQKSVLMAEAREMLLRWENHDKATLDLWNTMNGWVYKGFEETYNRLGIQFDKTYYESKTYQLGKENVLEGLRKGIFFKKSDGSIWVDLTQDGLDEKILLRADGTSVYITQDIGTAIERYNQLGFNQLIYVVGNEQIYHFQVLKLILLKLGFKWANQLFHLSYGMVELPSGKMKSREGTVVDADDLLNEMEETARQTSKDLGKLEDYSSEEAEKTNKMLALGALKYFILKVDPKKNMLFNPTESIDFNGNTGPFIQYTHARICSVLRKARESEIEFRGPVNQNITMNEKETMLVKLILRYSMVINESAKELSPAIIANYLFELAKEYNQFYHDFSILKETEKEIKLFRLRLSQKVVQVLFHGLNMLGINSPERM